MGYSTANGQLAASTAAILSTAPLVNQRCVDMSFRNTHTGSEAVVLTVLQTDGTARGIVSVTLLTGEQMYVTGLVLGPEDTVKGHATDAAKVDYRITPSQADKFSVTVLSATGALKTVATPTAMGTLRIPLTSARQPDWTATGTTAVAGANSLEGTVGTSLSLNGEAAQNNTKTGATLFEVELPPSYVAGNNLSLIINVQRVVSSGTTLTTTIDAEVWLMADAGTNGSDICATTVITFTDTTGADKTFTITGTTLTPGARLLIRATGVATEGDNAGTVYTRINSLRLVA